MASALSLSERKTALLTGSQVLHAQIFALAKDEKKWAEGFTQMRREVRKLFNDMITLNGDLREAKEISVAPVFLQKSCSVMRSVKNGQLSIEQARTQLQAFPAPAAKAPASSETASDVAINSKTTLYQVFSPTGQITTANQEPGPSRPPVSVFPILSSLTPLPPPQLFDELQQSPGADEEEAEEEKEMAMVKGEEIERKLSVKAARPKDKKYVDDEGEVQESTEPEIKGPSLVPCERCVEFGYKCLAFNIATRSVCWHCYKKKRRCSNSKKARREASRNGGGPNATRSKSRPRNRATPAAKPRRVLSTRVDELEQVIDDLQAEVSDRNRNDKMENALLTIANFVQKHTELVKAQAEAERGTAQRLRMLEAALAAAGIQIPREADDGPPSNSHSGLVLNSSRNPVNDFPTPPDPTTSYNPAQNGRKRTVSDVSSTESPTIAYKKSKIA